MKKYTRIAGIKLNRINSNDPRVPNAPTPVILRKNDQKALAIAIRDNINTLLIGETGTGKTSAVKNIAYSLAQPYVRVSMNGYTTPDELIGSKSVKDGATYYELGIVTEAMKSGAILVLDEINATAPDCLFILHALLDDERKITLPNGEIITPHKDFRVFATCNPDYEGTKSINKAFLDRFGIVLQIDALTPAKESALIQERTGADKITADGLTAVANMARKEYAKGAIFQFMSTRSLLATAKLSAGGDMPLKEAYSAGIVRKSQSLDEQKILLDLFNAVFKLSDAGEISLTSRIILESEYSELQRKATEYNALETEKRTLEADFNLTESKVKELENDTEELRKIIQTLRERLDEKDKTINGFQSLQELLKQVK